MMKNVFIIGSKGIPAQYGGFETFVDRLIEHQKSDKIKYHVACLDVKDTETSYQNARCFHIAVPEIGSAKAVYYDLRALKKCVDYIQKEHAENAVVYVLACRIGPFIGYYKRKLKKMGVKLYLNPDGHEWKRGKWNRLVRAYWKVSEKYMVKYADLVICDSRNIETYIRKDYRKYEPNTVFIPYGAEYSGNLSEASEEKWKAWAGKHKVQENGYYLIVGRFVPENNFLTMISEFHRSATKKKLIIITNPDNKHLYKQIMEIPGIDDDHRVCFVGTVYNKELLQQIRKHAFAYLHGHEVGGTNPSLLEALAATKINLLLDVGFNREVAEKGALYWTKEKGSLSGLLQRTEELSQEQVKELNQEAERRIEEVYNWDCIVKLYELLFLNQNLKFSEDSRNT